MCSKWNILGLRILCHLVEEIFHRDGDEDGSLGRSQRQLAGTLDGRRQQRFCVDAITPFNASVDEPCGSADIGQSTEPLRAYIWPGFFAESERFAGEHHHWNLLVERAAQRHGRV